MKNIVIIGGGVSGTLVAANLLRQAATPTRIVIVDRSPPIGRGVAYGTSCPEHLLNVPADRLGAYPDDPTGFFAWVAARIGRSTFPHNVTPSDFLPRSLYGQYIYSVLTEARTAAQKDVSLEIVIGEAIDIEETSAGPVVILANERTFPASQVVLALGNLPGEYPIRRALRFFHGPRYVHVPWTDTALEGINPSDEILIVGAGLTAADIILQLASSGHRGTIHALSRRGLLPQPQRSGPVYPDFLRNQPLPPTARAAFHLVKTEARKALANGQSWQSVIDSLRPYTQAIWKNWSWDERSRFLRHVRPYWEGHRHRYPPQTNALLDRLRESGQLRFYAGRLQSLTETSTGAEAVFRHRGKDTSTSLTVAKVINCTGPRSDYSKYQHPLFINLLARGLIDHDPLALGLNANSDGELFRYRGAPSGWLLTLGAPLKGVLWETSAVAEIRVQARALAAKILSIPEPAEMDEPFKKYKTDGAIAETRSESVRPGSAG
ncbi:MAG: FAD/NAD(P)-binding protein [Nibricoccus sp.]